MLLMLAGAARAGENVVETYPLLDRLYVQPEPPARLGEGQTYALTFFHDYMMPLHDFRITCNHPDCAVEISPAEVPLLRALETREVRIKVVPRPDVKLSGDRVDLPLAFSAKELTSRETWTLTIPLTARAEVELRDAYGVPAGQVEVRVRRWAGWQTWAYTLGSVILLAALVWRWAAGRKLRARRPRSSQIDGIEDQ
ncbi:MAG: hypothetical protein ACYTFI_00575 [Planctomycetota bacterium]